MRLLRSAAEEMGRSLDYMSVSKALTLGPDHPAIVTYKNDIYKIGLKYGDYVGCS